VASGPALCERAPRYSRYFLFLLDLFPPLWRERMFRPDGTCCDFFPSPSAFFFFLRITASSAQDRAGMCYGARDAVLKPFPPPFYDFFLLSVIGRARQRPEPRLALPLLSFYLLSSFSSVRFQRKLGGGKIEFKHLFLSSFPFPYHPPSLHRKREGKK